MIDIVGRRDPACCPKDHVLASAHHGTARISADSNDFRLTMITPLMAQRAIQLEDPTMAGESAHFGLRHRVPTPAIRPFEFPPRLQAMGERAKAAFAEPFRGIAPDGKLASGVFSIEKTGISLAPVMEAARAFLATLTAAQRKAASFATGDEAWRMWCNIHPWVMRHGVCLADLGHDQRKAALALLRETLSAAGYQSARDVMRLNGFLGDLIGAPQVLGEWSFIFCLFGIRNQFAYGRCRH